MDYCHCAFVGLSEGQHTFKAYDGSEHGRVRCLSRCEVEREVAAEFTRIKEQVFPENLAGAAALVAERDYYTDAKGGKYIGNGTLKNLEIEVAKLRSALADANRRVSAYQQDNAELKQAMRILLDEMALQAEVPDRVRADRAATQAILDKPYWAEGIDPDEP
jgi:hypothetical protein